MSIKKYMRDRVEKESLIDEVKDILLDGSPKELSKYRKFGLESVHGFLKLLLSLGNTAFNSGDPEVIERFMRALCELTVSGVLDKDTYLGRIQHYGLRTIHGFDYDSFTVILDRFLDYIYGLKETDSVIASLKVLKRFSRGVVSEGYEAGMVKLVDMFAELDEFFETEGMRVNRFYLRNVVISMVYFAGRDGDESLRKRVIIALMDARSDGILGLGENSSVLANTKMGPSSEKALGHVTSVG